MKISYTKNYFKIYFWQGISIILNLISLFIVVPHVSRLPQIYGIYSICIAVSIFLSYADLGFMSAGFKYASESYARQNRDEEVKITGFVSFIMLLFVSIYVIVILYFAFYPHSLIINLTSSFDMEIAFRLLFIQAFSSIITILQRCLQIIYGVRLEDFVYQRILIGGSTLKIISVFYFFSGIKYDIVGYYLFTQIINLVALIIGLWITKKRYNYNLYLYFSSIRFSKEIYIKTKRLALGALLLTISWVLYYELDTFVIAKLSGAIVVAYYAIGLTILSFFRSIFGTLFGPFNARFNHFIGVGNESGLKTFYKHIICITLPLVVFPIISLYILMGPFIVSWVGITYTTSIRLTQWLILSNILGFISYPTGILIVALHKIKLLNIISFVFPVIFWLGIFLTFKEWGIMSFAFFKFISFMIAGVIYVYIAVRFLKFDVYSFLSECIFPAIIPVLFIILSLNFIVRMLPLEKSKLYMVFTIIAGGGASLGGIILYFCFSGIFRRYALELFYKFREKLIVARIQTHV